MSGTPDTPDFITITNLVPASIVRAARQFIEDLPPEEFDEYRHKFEPKLMVKKGYYWSQADLAPLLERLVSMSLREVLRESFMIPAGRMALYASNYFTAFYVYRPGDYLQNHIDAAVHDGQRKVITINFYLSDCEGGDLIVGGQRLAVKENYLVAFANHDNSFHAVSPVTAGRRIMVTTGLCLPANLFPLANYTRMNRKAWFVPADGQVWGEDDFRLRDERASENWRPM